VKTESACPDPVPDAFPLIMFDVQCPDCLGDGSLTLPERTFTYCRTAVRNDHFDDHHLIMREDAEQRGEAQICKYPKCSGMKFQGLDHFRHHIAKVHRVVLRSSDQVARRRQ
jgi:hypothetical protein